MIHSSNPRASLWVALWALAAQSAWAGPALAVEESSPAPAKEDDAALAEARLHFSNGVELLQATPPNYQDAYPQFLAAYEKSGQSWKVLGNLGLCALKLERDGEALAYYRAYLAEGGDEIDEDERAAIQQELLLVEGNLAEVSISSPRPNVQVQISRQSASAPPQLYRLGPGQTVLGLRAGAHTLTAQADSKVQTWEVVLTPGQQASHVFDFAPPPSSHGPPAGPPEEAAGDASNPLRVTGWITAGVGTAALLGGAVTGIMMRQQERSARDQCTDNVCPTSTRDDFSRAQSLAGATNLLLIGGGVLTATGIALILMGGSSKNRESANTQLLVAPSALPSGGGLWATGTF